jgi:hypothetical protein
LLLRPGGVDNYERLPPKRRHIALLGALLLVTGAAAELFHVPRLPAPEDEEAPGLCRAKALSSLPRALEDRLRLAALLDRVGADWGPELRVRFGEALLEEAGRGAFDPVFLLALVGVESRYHVRAESGRGARGLAQLMPSTFAWIAAREPDVGGVELETGDDPVVDLRLAARYFGWLEHRFHSRDAALVAYNAGPMNAHRAERGEIVPGSWQRYPHRVRREYERLLGMAAETRPRLDPILLASLP